VAAEASVLVNDAGEPTEPETPLKESLLATEGIVLSSYEASISEEELTAEGGYSVSATSPYFVAHEKFFRTFGEKELSEA
jgi:hypothetical protein